MRQFIKSYTNFTRTERTGLVVLCTMIGLLIGFIATMHLWAKPEIDDKKEEQELVAKWNAVKTQQNATTGITDVSVKSEKSAESEVQTLFPFDPNTIDSTGLRKLGLKEKTTSIFLNWRRKGKRFYRKEELRSLYTLSQTEYQQLEPYIVIRNLTVELNKADSTTLVRLKGIGPKLAHKIIERRKTIGAFTRHEELLEIYRFPDSVFAELKETLVINPLSP